MRRLTPVERQLRAYLDAHEPELARFLFDTWNAEADAIKLEAIRAALAAGHFSQSWLDRWRQQYSKLVNENIRPMVEAAMLQGAKDALNDLGSAGDLAAHAIRNYADTKMSAMITRLTESQRDATTTVLKRFIFDPEGTPNPVDVARYLRPIIGLTKQQEEYVWNYYQDQLGNDVPKADALDAANAYADKLRAQRAETIARTEMSSAFNRGGYDGIVQAAADGLFPGRVTKGWLTAEDEIVCPICSALGELEPIELSETYEVAGGAEVLTAPAHPRCRCTNVYHVERDTGAEDITTDQEDSE